MYVVGGAGVGQRLRGREDAVREVEMMNELGARAGRGQASADASSGGREDMMEVVTRLASTRVLCYSCCLVNTSLR